MCLSSQPGHSHQRGRSALSGANPRLFAPPAAGRMQGFPWEFGEAVMVPGIDPKVDIVFKRLFGTEPNADLSCSTPSSLFRRQVS
jgi:hypothetical protein